MKQKKGFTLIELLIVIGVISILAAIIFVAVDPARRLAEARNAERWSSVNSILNAYLKYTVDNAGSEPVTLVADDEYMIGTANDTCTATTTGAAIDLAGLVNSGYLSAMPTDPSSGSAATTDYWIKKKGNGRLIVGSCAPETVGGSTPTIEVSR